MMDVSGSMTDEQKQIVRTEAFWLDTWLQSQYDGLERATSSTTRRPRKSTRTRSTTPAKAAARGSARPTRCAPNLIAREFPPADWNIYCFQFSDGDNWGEDNEAKPASCCASSCCRT